MPKISPEDIVRRKQIEHTKITVLTAYDFPFARLVDQAGIDIVLVGDSVGMVCLGYESTTQVTMDEMMHHVKAARRAVKHALLVADMPYHSYTTASLTLKNAKRFTKSGGADAVKLEGGKKIKAQIKTLIDSGIPVMGHLGMLPQSVKAIGGYKVQGRKKGEADQMMEDALLLEKLGAFSIVLECVPLALTKKMSRVLKIPTIGIGAGPYADGQVLVLHDLLGIRSTPKPLRFARAYAHLEEEIIQAVREYREDVLTGKFPTFDESFE